MAPSGRANGEAPIDEREPSGATLKAGTVPPSGAVLWAFETNSARVSRAELAPERLQALGRDGQAGSRDQEAAGGHAVTTDHRRADEGCD